MDFQSFYLIFSAVLAIGFGILFIICVLNKGLLFLYPFVPILFSMGVNSLKIISKMDSITPMQVQQFAWGVELINWVNAIWFLGIFPWGIFAYRELKKRGRPAKVILLTSYLVGVSFTLSLLISWLVNR